MRSVGLVSRKWKIIILSFRIMMRQVCPSAGIHSIIEVQFT